MPRKASDPLAVIPSPEAIRQRLTETLTLAERLRILLDLSESDTAPPPDVQTAWDEEIERRLQELRTGAVRGVPLDEVKRKIEAGFRS